MKVRFLIDNTQEHHNDSIYYWRVRSPIKHLKHYIDVDVVNIGRDVDPDTDILVLPKTQVEVEFREDAKAFLDEVRSNGTKLVYDTDDDIFSEHYVAWMTQIHTQEQTTNVAYVNECVKFFQERAENNKWVMQQADFVTVSTTKLGNVIPDKPTILIPNAIDVRGFQRQIKDRPKPKALVIGWSGGARPVSELTPMLNAWERIAQQYDVRFVIHGWHPPLDGYKHFIRKCEYRPWKSINEYANDIQFDIGCVIASPNQVSMCKSNSKAWELSLANNLVIGSDVVYGAEPILTCGSEDDWFEMLEHMITANEVDREQLANVYTENVRYTKDIYHNWINWRDAYTTILGG